MARKGMRRPAYNAHPTDNEIERNQGWNIGVNVLDSAFHGLSIGFVSITTILPLYVSHLSNSPLLIGLVAAIGGSAGLFPQLLVANYIERQSRRKPIVVKAGFFLERVPFLFMACAALTLSLSYRAAALWCFFVGLLWHNLGEGVVVIAWRDMLAKLIRNDLQGRFFGVANFAEALMGIIGSAIAAGALVRLTFPYSFSALFGLAFCGLSIAWVFLALNREPSAVPKGRPVRHVAYLRSLPSIVRKDSQFKAFLINRALLGTGRMGVGFVTVYAVQRWHLPDSVAGQFTAVLLLAQAIAYPILGFIGDAGGHKRNIILGQGALALSMLLCVVATGPTWFYVVYVLISISAAAESLSGQIIIFGFAKDNERPTYIGLVNTLVGGVGLVSSIVGGVVADVLGYPAVFEIAICIMLLSVASAVAGFDDPRHSKAG